MKCDQLSLGATSVPHGAAAGGHLQGQDGGAATTRAGTATAAATATTATTAAAAAASAAHRARRDGRGSPGSRGRAPSGRPGGAAIEEEEEESVTVSGFENF